LAAVSARRLSHERLLRLGLALGAAAALAAAAAGFFALAEGPARRAPMVETARLDVEPMVSIVAVVALALIAAAVLVPRPVLRPLAVFATNSVAFVAGIQLLGARVDGVFAPDVRTTLLGGAILLLVAFWTALGAVALQLLALGQIARARPVEPQEVLDALPRADGGRPLRSSPKATLGAVMGVAGLIAPMLSGAAAAVSIGALGDIRAADGRLGGRGLALGGIVLGSIGLSLIISFLGVAPFLLRPGT
jgi:hypothetical protein